MSTDAGSAAAPEDSATRDVASERPGLESGDPGAADSATSTPETADRGVEGSADTGSDSDSDSDSGTDSDGDDVETAPADGGRTVTDDSVTDDSGTDDSGTDGSGTGSVAGNPADEGFVASLLRDSTITGLPGETGAPPVEPHAPQAQQEGDEPVGAEGAAEADDD